MRAAAAAGYEGIGLRAENYWDAQSAGLDDDAMREIAAEHGVPILEVEYITAWGTGEDRNQAQQDKERAVFHMARAFGVHHLNTGLLEKLPLDVVTGLPVSCATEPAATSHSLWSSCPTAVFRTWPQPGEYSTTPDGPTVP